jgi:hypothetical protein
LDEVVLIVHHRWHGKRTEQDLPQTAFSRKIRYLRKVYGKTKELRDVIPHFDKILDRLEEASKYRHTIIHGAALDLHEFQGTGTVTMTRIVHKLQEVHSHRSHHSITMMRRYSRWILRLCVAVGSIGEILNDETDRPIGKLLLNLGREFPLRQ